jgi:cytochrome c-type biogenesis protein CcmF
MIGKLLVYILFAISCFGTITYFLSYTKKKELEKIGRYFYYTFLVGFISVSIYQLSNILAHNFQFTYIWEYSSRELPLNLLISSFYAGQEGSFMLWTLILSIIGFFLLPYTKKYGYESLVMGFYFLIFVFLTMILIFKSPFNYVWESFPNEGLQAGFMPQNGRGLNPILENYWMSIHPPILFIGYSAMTVPFVFAISGLIKREYTRWIDISMPWTLFGTGVLGLGIMLGGFWAYETLGWGGFWGWDPVENSSLLPWLVGVALVHTMLVQKRTGGLIRTNFILSVTVFILVLYATFLTRSGVLGESSVHSFVSPGQIVYLLLMIFQITFSVIGLTVVFYRYDDIPGAKLTFNLKSREFLLSTGALILLAMTMIVFTGTSVIIIFQAFIIITGIILLSKSVASFLSNWKESKRKALIGSILYFSLTLLVLVGWYIYEVSGLSLTKSTIDISFYNRWNLPLAVLLLLVNAVSIYFKWKNTEIKQLYSRFLYALVFSLIGMLIILIAGVSEIGLLLLGFSGFFTLFINVNLFFKNIRSRPYHAGAYFSHIGIALMMLGVLTSGPFSKTKHLSLKLDESQSALGYKFTFTGKTRIQKEKMDREKYEYHIEVVKEKTGVVTSGVVSPVIYWSNFNNREAPFLEPGIKSHIIGDLYISPKNVEQDANVPFVVLAKGESNPLPIDSNESIKLVQFDMSHTAEEQGGDVILFGAVVEFENKGGKLLDTLFAHLDLNTGSCIPIWETIRDTGYEVGFMQFIPDRQEMSLSRAALVFKKVGEALPEPTEILNIDVSTKPYIWLVWAGVIAIVTGFFVSIKKRINKNKEAEKEKVVDGEKEVVEEKGGELVNIAMQ